MDKFDIFQNCKCLYTPKGAAREYAAVGCDFYRGCPYQCRYCYNRKGITAGVMGVDHAVLESCFISMKYRPKKYREVSGEDYAFMVFREEVTRHLDYLRTVGIFFSFSTDPMARDTIGLTMSAMMYATCKGIPVKVLTKNAAFTVIDKTVFRNMPQQQRQLMTIGFTLTGRDDEEANASPNGECIAAMREFHGMGYKTFASIEPIVDFDSSYRMIKETVGFCDLYKIGLMSSRGQDYPPYEKKDCVRFIRKVMKLLKKQEHPAKVYWKKSLVEYVKDSRAARNVMFDESVFVEKEYSIHLGTITYPIHYLAHKALPSAVQHLEALAVEVPVRERKHHETALISFYRHFHEMNSMISYIQYLAHQDIEHLDELMRDIKDATHQFLDCYKKQMNKDCELRPFLVKTAKDVEFPTELLYYFTSRLLRICDAALSDINKVKRERKEGQL